MNGIHDMGGMHGHGPVSVELDEPVFHRNWEARVMGITFPIMAQCGNTSDKHRFAVERMDPAYYLTSSYYEHWLCSLETQLLEKGLITSTELKNGRAESMQKATPVLLAENVQAVLAAGAPARRPDGAMPRFKPGDRVLTSNVNPVTHTRLPRYARGRIGVVEIDHGIFITPDYVASDLGEKPQHLYSVRFSARELWGGAASPIDSVRLDVWDEFMEKAQSDE